MLKKIHFEDHGQDFLEWTLDEEGFVIDCTPAQGSFWCMSGVNDHENLKVGDHVTIINERWDDELTINYPIERIQVLMTVDEALAAGYTHCMVEDNKFVSLVSDMFTKELVEKGKDVWICQRKEKMSLSTDDIRDTVENSLLAHFYALDWGLEDPDAFASEISTRVNDLEDEKLEQIRRLFNEIAEETVVYFSNQDLILVPNDFPQSALKNAPNA